MKKRLNTGSAIITGLMLCGVITGLPGWADESVSMSTQDDAIEQQCVVPPDYVESFSGPHVAPNIDLKKVAPLEKLVPHQLPESSNETDQVEVITPQTAEQEVVVSDEAVTDNTAKSLFILGSEVAPGTATRLAWAPASSIEGLASPTPVLVVNGINPGPTLCLTGAIHGDELNGIEIVRRIIYDISADKLSGRVVAIPIVNLQGFQRVSRYLPDRRDLNRSFPGRPEGSLAARMAYSLFNQVIKHCDYLIDIHTGSMLRTNVPQIRADLKNPDVAEFVELFDDIAVVNSRGRRGMLRDAAVKIGIPSITLEAGESLILQEIPIKIGVDRIRGLLKELDMYGGTFNWGEPEPVFYKSYWIRAQKGGILLSQVKLGADVKKGDLLGIVIDPITNETWQIKSTIKGRVIGKAINQVVMPGFAAYHIGVTSNTAIITEESMLEDNELEEMEMEEAEEEQW